MQSRRPFSFRKRLKSFSYAYEGLKVLLQTQHNARIHVGLAIFALCLCFWLEVGKIELCLILFAIVLVWMAEAFNTVFEILTTMVSPTHSIKAKRAKDVAAGVVLVTSVGALIIGLTILGPPLMVRLGQF